MPDKDIVLAKVAMIQNVSIEFVTLRVLTLNA